VDDDWINLSFTPDASQDAIWFKQYKIDAEYLEISMQDKNRLPEPGSRYAAIINIRTSGQCAAYIIYQGSLISL
jgi:hypothetical protein